MSIKAKDLVAGDHIRLANVMTTAVFIGRSTHPLYTSLCAVVWYFPDGHWLDPDMRFSVDALDPDQEVGEITNISRTPQERVNDLQKMLQS